MELIKLFLDKLNCPREEPSYTYLEKLTQAYLRQCPYESISKILYRRDHGVGVPTFEAFLETNIETGLGGTCFLLNSSFTRLVQELGFHAEMLPANSGDEVAAHLVSKVRVGEDWYIVDFGLMGPFVGPHPFVKGYSTEMQSGNTRYTYECNGETFLTKIYRDKCRPFQSHSQTQDFSYFENALKASFDKDALFMKTIATYREFDGYGKGIWQNELFIVDSKGRHEKHPLKDIEDMRRAYDEELMFPHFPVENAVEAIRDYTGVDVFNPPSIV